MVTVPILQESPCRIFFNRPGVAGAVLQSASLLIKSLRKPFPPNLQNIINYKPEELGSRNFERMFTPHNLSHVTCCMSRVTCHMSRVMCHMSHVTCIFFFTACEAYCWRVCYQRGLPHLFFLGGGCIFLAVLWLIPPLYPYHYDQLPLQSICERSFVAIPSQSGLLASPNHPAALATTRHPRALATLGHPRAQASDSNIR